MSAKVISIDGKPTGWLDMEERQALIQEMEVTLIEFRKRLREQRQILEQERMAAGAGVR